METNNILNVVPEESAFSGAFEFAGFSLNLWYIAIVIVLIIMLVYYMSGPKEHLKERAKKSKSVEKETDINNLIDAINRLQ